MTVTLLPFLPRSLLLTIVMMFLMVLTEDLGCCQRSDIPMSSGAYAHRQADSQTCRRAINARQAGKQGHCRQTARPGRQ